jgi:hypothetical protein
VAEEIAQGDDVADRRRRGRDDAERQDEAGEGNEALHGNETWVSKAGVGL